MVFLDRPSRAKANLDKDNRAKANWGKDNRAKGKARMAVQGSQEI